MKAETGSMQFGDDWPGLFVRGDNAFGYMLALKTVVDGQDYTGFYKLQLRGFIQMLESSDARTGGAPQMMRPFDEAVASDARLTMMDEGTAIGSATPTSSSVVASQEPPK